MTKLLLDKPLITKKTRVKCKNAPDISLRKFNFQRHLSHFIVLKNTKYKKSPWH